MSWIILGIMILGVIILNKYRAEEEEMLIPKLIGYSSLGAFKFLLQGFPLPLGFILYMFLFRPKTNVKIKKVAAILGLGIFFLGLLIEFSTKR
jgi:hypothetical protein